MGPAAVVRSIDSRFAAAMTCLVKLDWLQAQGVSRRTVGQAKRVSASLSKSCRTSGGQTQLLPAPLALCSKSCCLPPEQAT